MPASRQQILLTLVFGWGLFFLTSNPAQATEITPIKFVTSNGIIVLILEQHSLPIVEIHALIRAGSAQDPPEKAGLANIVASLLDEGTATRTSKQLAEQIEFVGGFLETKASEDFTMVSARVLQKDLSLGFVLLADMLQHPAFHPHEFERIRTQILGEMASDKDDPGHIAMNAFNQLVFHEHPYRWAINGTEQTLKQITLADVRDFYKQEYSPTQVILTIVGDITLKQARTLVGTHLGSWGKKQVKVRNTSKPSPVQKQTVQLIEKDLTQSTIVLGHGGIARAHPDFYPVTVMNYILGAGGFSSRLMNSIRDKQGLAYGISSHFDARLMPGSFWVSLQTKTETTNQAITSVLSEMKTIRDAPVSNQELAEAKSFLTGSFPLRLDSTAKLTKILGQVEFYGLGFEYFTQYTAWINRVTKEDVQRVANQYLNPQRYALVVVGNLASAKVNP